MDMKILAKCDAEKIILPGSYGYESEYIYESTRYELDSEISFKLLVRKLSKPYKKIWNEEEAVINRYKEMIGDGISILVSSGNRTAGVLIAEKRDWNNSAYIEKLQIADEFKRTGIGSRLITKFVQLTAERGYRIIHLETQNTNYPAIQFYLKNGFSVTGLDMKLYEGDESKDEVAIYMARELI